MWRLLFSLVVLQGGCDTVFGLHRPPDAPPDTPQPPPEHCSPVGLLDDDFGRAAVETWGLSDARIVNGHVEFGTGPYPTLYSGYFYDLRDNSFAIDVGIADLSPGEGDVRLELRAEAGLAIDVRNTLDMVSDGVTLSAMVIDGGVVKVVDSTPYDPAQHATWRIVHELGAVRFEAGPLGGPFSVVGAIPSPPWVGYMQVTLGLTRPDSTSYQVFADNVKGGATGPACSVKYLTDDFSAAVRDQKWSRTYAQPGGVVGTVGGVLSMTAPATAPSGSVYASLAPSAIQDLRDGAFVVEIPTMVDQSDVTQNLAMTVSTIAGLITIEQRGGTLEARRPGYLLVDSRPYDPVAHRWWQIREAEGRVFWEVSGDGRTFQTLGSAAGLTNLDRVGVAVDVNSVHSPRALTAEIDNIGLPP